MWKAAGFLSSFAEKACWVRPRMPPSLRPTIRLVPGIRTGGGRHSWAWTKDVSDSRVRSIYPHRASAYGTSEARATPAYIGTSSSAIVV